MSNGGSWGWKKLLKKCLDATYCRGNNHKEIATNSENAEISVINPVMRICKNLMSSMYAWHLIQKKTKIMLKYSFWMCTTVNMGQYLSTNQTFTSLSTPDIQLMSYCFQIHLNISQFIRSCLGFLHSKVSVWLKCDTAKVFFCFVKWPETLDCFLLN